MNLQGSKKTETAVLQHHLSRFLPVRLHRDWNLTTEPGTENDRHPRRFNGTCHVEAATILGASE